MKLLWKPSESNQEENNDHSVNKDIIEYPFGYVLIPYEKGNKEIEWA